jgi:aminopeptidase N
VRSLTHEEAQRRADLIRVTGYDVDLDLTTGGEQFASRTTIRFRAEPGAATFVEVAARELSRASLNGRPLDAAELAGGRLPVVGLSDDNELVVEAMMAYSHDGEGLHRHVDPADGRPYLYAMSFLDAAPRWFACFDQPDLKAPFALTVSCDPTWTVLGNGPAQRLAAGHWRIVSAHPIATYFATLVAGPYHSVRSTHDGIPLGVHTRASLARELDAQAREMLELTAACLDEFHRLFGVRYPWGEYHQAFVPDFNAGAMENPACVTFRDAYVFRSRATDAERNLRATTIAHEMAHMWFGNLVTMRWWDDLWLNESFAEYLAYRVCDAVDDYPVWVAFASRRKAWGYAADRRPSTHPVAGNGVADAKTALNDFDGISYAKGASALRQLAVRLGDDTLLRGLRDYFRAHAYANATFADLIGAWTAAGARDLEKWAEVWLRTSGLDTLSVGSGPVVYRTGDADRPHAVRVTAFTEDGAELAGQNSVLLDAVPLTVPETPALVLPDARDDTWAKTALAADVWERMPSLLPALEDPLARVSVWNALRLAVADAEVSADQALRIVEAAASGEPDAVLGPVLRWAVDTVAGVYLREGMPRAEGLRRVARTADGAMRAAPPASGRQLAAVRGYVAAMSDTEQLRAWLAGERLPDGVVVDDELRWAVLARLSSLGALTADEIDAELARDRSAPGQVHAAGCRAMLPSDEAKAAAWQAIMTDFAASNYEVYALAEGFWHPEQTELTAPYVARYFDEIAATARLRQGWVVARLAWLAYPRTAVSQGTLDRSAALLARPDLDSGIRRSVVDAGDDLRRALASRARFS